MSLDTFEAGESSQLLLAICEPKAEQSKANLEPRTNLKPRHMLNHQCAKPQKTFYISYSNSNIKSKHGAVQNTNKPASYPGRPQTDPNRVLRSRGLWSRGVEAGGLEV